MISKDIAIEPGTPAMTDDDRAYARTATRLQVASAVWVLWDRLRKERDLDQQWLADRMGKGKSRISRLLGGPGNWTLDTVADLLEAMGGRLTCVEAHTYSEIAQGDAWKAQLTKPPQTRVMVLTETYVIEDDGLRPWVDVHLRPGRTLIQSTRQHVIEGSFTE